LILLEQDLINEYDIKAEIIEKYRHIISDMYETLHNVRTKTWG